MYNSHLMLLGEFVVVSHLTIFPLELLGLAEKLMAGPSSTKGKIVRLDTFQISGGKNNCLLLPVVQLKSKKPCMYPFHNKPENIFCWVLLESWETLFSHVNI